MPEITHALLTMPSLALWVIPGAKREEIIGFVEGAEGMRLLKIKVIAAPEDGKANDAVIALLAKHCGVAKSRLTIIAGHTSRHKRIALAS